ncbi:class I adenylate-forming enzyme family protein [Dyella sp.]|uniref:class I adenylate-forming enzyme family protein n=1 Tax=Dyella sp. TaxID=1869338 RepID=UPI002ED0292B
MSQDPSSLTATLRVALQHHALAGRVAFLEGDASIDYAHFAQRVDRYAAGFANTGLPQGAFVGIASPKTLDCVAALFGAMVAGLCPTIMEARISPSELASRMSAVGMTLLACADGEWSQAIEDALALVGASTVALTSLDSTQAVTLPALQATDRALLLYTSGSTGRPKGVVLSHGNLLANAQGVLAHTGVTEADRLLHIMPLHHTNGINNQLIVPLLAGAQVALVERFRADDIVDCLRRYRPTYVTGVPTMYSRMLPKLEAGERFESLRFLRCGSAPITPALHEAIEAAFGVPLVVSYGLSEATCTTTMNPPHARKVGSIGTVLEGQELALFQPGGDERVAAGQDGEIRIRGPALMQGYVGADVESPIVDGWLRTGDLGRFDAEGYVTITGRIKDVIIRGGENLSPGLIENQLAKHPSVKECCVVGVADADLGEVPVAFVVPRSGEELHIEALREHVLTGLSRVYVPARIVVVASLPTSHVGKVDRKVLRRMAGEPSTEAAA